MDASTTGMPWRITVGEQDDNLYICDWSDAHGNLWRTDGDLATNGLATNVFALLRPNSLLK
jgi:hypothetical protein